MISSGGFHCRYLFEVQLVYSSVPHDALRFHGVNHSPSPPAIAFPQRDGNRAEGMVARQHTLSKQHWGATLLHTDAQTVRPLNYIADISVCAFVSNLFPFHIAEIYEFCPIISLCHPFIG